ncbi:MAG TPA: IS66 family transposase [Blastocatellia bacterium]|nr:IS66 family transposase [Blastocatellia bacterium]
MMLPTGDQLDQISHADLVALVKALIARVERLEEENRQLKAEIERLKQPPANSRNSSQPPSRDQKSNQPGDRPKKKHGPPFGHKRSIRKLIDNPDQTISVKVEQCAHCHHDLSRVAPEKIVRRQITELPEFNPAVIETKQHEVICPHCQCLNRGQLPEGLEADRYFGPRLEAAVVFLKHQQHLSYERIVQALRELFGVEVSEGGIASIIARAGSQAARAAADIKQQVVSSPVIKSDETSARVSGRNFWHWVFIGASAVYHQIVPRRNAKVIEELMGEARAEVWVCDCFGAQLKAPARVFQLCLQHQLRDLQRVLDRQPDSPWAAEMQKLFREAIHLNNRVDCPEPQLTLTGFMRRVSEIENDLDALLNQRLTLPGERKLQNRYLPHREKLLTFLYHPGVPPTNNQSEQALRTSVIHRKVTNGFRSDWGAKAYTDLLSVITTLKIKGQRVFETLVNLMGPPVLQFLAASSP